MKKLNEIEKKAGSKVLDELRKHAQSMMSGKMKGLKKVTVASNTPEGLKKGLSTAEKILESKKNISSDLLEPEEELEKQTEDDSLEHESEESPEYEAGENEGEEENLSEEELDAKIKHLMSLKANIKK